MNEIPNDILKENIFCFLEKELYTVYRLVCKNWHFLMKNTKNCILAKEIITCIKKGYLNILKWLPTRIYTQQRNEHYWIEISKNNNDNNSILEWLSKQYPTCPCSDDTYIFLIENEHFNVLGYAMMSKPKSLLELVVNYILKINNNRSCLKWIFSQNYCISYDEKIIKHIIKKNYVDILEIIIERGYFHYETKWSSYAAQVNKIDVLKYFKGKNYPWGSHVCLYAAEYGNLEMLKWARSQNPPAPWDEWTSNCASKTGQLNVLKWLHEQNPPCPITETCYFYAKKNGRLNVEKWLIENNYHIKK